MYHCNIMFNIYVNSFINPIGKKAEWCDIQWNIANEFCFNFSPEHRNMPLDDAILLVSRNFDTYMQALRERERSRDRGPPLPGDPLAPRKGFGIPGAVSSVVPSPYSREISQLLNIAADGRPLTVDEYTLVIDEFTKIRNDLLRKEGRVPPSPSGRCYVLVRIPSFEKCFSYSMVAPQELSIEVSISLLVVIF